MSNFEPFNYIGELLSGVAAGFAGWLYGRKKNNKEVDALEIANFKEILHIHKETIDALKAEQKEIRDQLSHCREEMLEVLNKKLKSLKKEQ